MPSWVYRPLPEVQQPLRRAPIAPEEVSGEPPPADLWTFTVEQRPVSAYQPRIFAPPESPVVAAEFLPRASLQPWSQAAPAWNIYQPRVNPVAEEEFAPKPRQLWFQPAATWPQQPRPGVGHLAPEEIIEPELVPRPNLQRWATPERWTLFLQHETKQVIPEEVTAAFLVPPNPLSKPRVDAVRWTLYLLPEAKQVIPQDVPAQFLLPRPPQKPWVPLPTYGTRQPRLGVGHLFAAPEVPAEFLAPPRPQQPWFPPPIPLIRQPSFGAAHLPEPVAEEEQPQAPPPDFWGFTTERVERSVYQPARRASTIPFLEPEVPGEPPGAVTWTPFPTPVAVHVYQQRRVLSSFPEPAAPEFVPAPVLRAFLPVSPRGQGLYQPRRGLTGLPEEAEVGFVPAQPVRFYTTPPGAWWAYQPIRGVGALFAPQPEPAEFLPVRRPLWTGLPPAPWGYQPHIGVGALSAPLPEAAPYLPPPRPPLWRDLPKWALVVEPSGFLAGPPPEPIYVAPLRLPRIPKVSWSLYLEDGVTPIPPVAIIPAEYVGPVRIHRQLAAARLSAVYQMTVRRKVPVAPPAAAGVRVSLVGMRAGLVSGGLVH